VKIQENYTAPRMVLAASGVEHEELLAVAEPLLADLPSVPRPEEPKSTYVGGDFRRHGEAGVCINFYIIPFIYFFYISFFSFIPLQENAVIYLITYIVRQATHVAIAFEVPGGWQKERDAIVLTVLQVFILCLIF
jgi:processing peptidase subunit alpha